jgi:hypothetical protein
MRRRFPKLEDCKFLLCDQARPEVKKKLTLLGLYAADRIVFHPSEIGQFPYVLPTLGFLLVAKGGIGTFDASFKMLTPNGDAQYDVKLSQVKMLDKHAAAIVVNFAAVKFDAVGQYTAEFCLEKRKYGFSFFVDHSSEKVT